MNNTSFSFQLIHTSKKSRARVGRIHTPHGIIDTPGFVAVGTNGAIKGLESPAVEELGVQLMFANTYHLMLQPGSKVIKEAGGLHKFMNRTQPIITDSGGFQVFSLMYGGVHQELKSQGTKQIKNSVIKINEEGVLFRSYRDGAPVFLTAESSIQAQKDIGADIIVSFDELPPYHMDQKSLRRSLDRTHRWEKRSLDTHLQNRNNQALYAVIHGGLDQELRKKSCDYLTSLAFDGFAVGGSLGKTREQMRELLTFVMPHLPTDKPNHLLGIADLPSIDFSIPLGVDTFDSAYPTKAARHGLLLTKRGRVRAIAGGNASYHRPIEDDCTCSTCKRFTLSYLCHLFKAHELTAYTLATVHNLHFMVQLMANYRQQILNDEI
jgi:queuine tRNA-ribosyltransferase